MEQRRDEFITVEDFLKLFHVIVEGQGKPYPTCFVKLRQNVASSFRRREIVTGCFHPFSDEFTDIYSDGEIYGIEFSSQGIKGGCEGKVDGKGGEIVLNTSVGKITIIINISATTKLHLAGSLGSWDTDVEIALASKDQNTHPHILEGALRNKKTIGIKIASHAET